MAIALGLQDIRPLDPDGGDPLDKVVTFVPRADADMLVDALAAAGAGAIGAYDRCAFMVSGQGTFRPGAAARPTIGTPGRIEVVDESRIEMVLPRARRTDVLTALRAAHPYEEPAYDVFELAQDPGAQDPGAQDPGAQCPGARGTGRMGTLPEPVTLREFARLVVARLPRNAVGARVSGDLDATVSTIGLVGGAGDFMLEHVRRLGLDVFVTSDLRHHRASELREYDDAPALVDVPHWAAEATWLPQLSQVLSERLRATGKAVRCDVSAVCTDPWNHTTSPSPDPRSQP